MNTESANTTKIAIPPSLQYYFSSASNTAAIQTIIESKNTPPGLTWEEMEHFNNAKVSALVVQRDFWLLLKQIWNHSWGVLLNTSSLKVDLKEYYREDDTENSMGYSWNEGYLIKRYQWRGYFFGFSCCIDENGKIRLSFFVEDSDGCYAISDQLILSADWQSEPEEDERWTNESVLPKLEGQAEIDVSPLRSLAAEAIEKLKGQLGFR